MRDDDLVRILNELEILLGACGQEKEANWLRVQKMRISTTDPSELGSVKGELRGALAGMGSLDDLDLSPSAESKLDWKEAQARLQNLLDQLYQALSAQEQG